MANGFNGGPIVAPSAQNGDWGSMPLDQHFKPAGRTASTQFGVTPSGYIDPNARGMHPQPQIPFQQQSGTLTQAAQTDPFTPGPSNMQPLPNWNPGLNGDLSASRTRRDQLAEPYMQTQRPIGILGSARNGGNLLGINHGDRPF